MKEAVSYNSLESFEGRQCRCHLRIETWTTEVFSNRMNVYNRQAAIITSVAAQAMVPILDKIQSLPLEGN